MRSWNARRTLTAVAAVAAVGVMAATASPAQASGKFCGYNSDICITSHDNGEYLGGLEVGVFQSSNPGWTRVHVWSSDGRYNVWTGGQQGSWMRTAVTWVFPRRYFRSGTRICADATKNGRDVRGLPCFTIRA